MKKSVRSKIATLFFVFEASLLQACLMQPPTASRISEFQTTHANSSERCSLCHEIERPAQSKDNPHGGDRDCSSCHDTKNATWRSFRTWDHTSPETKNLCQSCHERGAPLSNSPLSHGQGMSCGECHEPAGRNWKKSFFPFPHFKLFSRFREFPMNCNSCHESHRKPNHFGNRDCYICHVTPALQGTPWKFNHQGSHLQGMKECLSCHEAKSRRAHALNQPQFLANPKGCIDCHDRRGKDWKPAT